MTKVPVLSVVNTRWSIDCRSVRRTQYLIAARGAAQQRLPGRITD